MLAKWYYERGLDALPSRPPPRPAPSPSLFEKSAARATVDASRFTPKGYRFRNRISRRFARLFLLRRCDQKKDRFLETAH